MRKMLAMILAAAMLLCCACASAEGTFRVGMECNYAPYNWTQAEASDYTVAIEGGGGYADGYDVQIARKIAEGLGKELVIVKTEWDGLPMGVMTGAFDATTPAWGAGAATVDSLRRTEGAQWTNGNTPASGIIRQPCRKQFPAGGV